MGLSTLSWIVLLASACNGIKTAGGLMAVLFIIMGVLLLIGGFGGFESYSTKEDETTKSRRKRMRFGSIVSLVVGVVLALFAAFIPSEKAMYMVAGIETINKFTQTDAAKELGESGMNIVKDISVIIHDYAIDEKDSKR